MQSTVEITKSAEVSSREQIEADLKYWSVQKEKAIKDKNTERVKVCNLLLDKYLDALNSLPKGL